MSSGWGKHTHKLFGSGSFQDSNLAAFSLLVEINCLILQHSAMSSETLGSTYAPAPHLDVELSKAQPGVYARTLLRKQSTVGVGPQRRAAVPCGVVQSHRGFAS